MYYENVMIKLSKVAKVSTVKTLDSERGKPMPSQSITAQEYQALLTERNDLIAKRDAADSEFMYQHYRRMLDVMDADYEKATRLNIQMEKREDREKSKAKREQLARKTSA